MIPRPHRRTLDHERIKRLRAEGKTYREIAEIVGCTAGAAWYACGRPHRKTYKAEEAKKLRAQGFKYRDIAEELGCALSTAYDLVNR